MFEDLWSSILELMARFVIPDWGSVIALLPLMILALIVMVLAWIFLKLYRAAPAQRGTGRIRPQTPPGIHMPGPSWSPILAALGAALLLLGLVFGGPLLVVGAVALVATLLSWLVEAVRIYDHDIGQTAPALPAPVHDGPPAGVHMPGPSFRPFLGALGAALLMLGLVFGGWLLVVGVIVLVVTLLGWLFDARKEYVKAVEADSTGHLENIPRPQTPSLLLAGIAILLVLGVMLQVGWLPPTQASETAAGASGEPAPASAGPAGSGDPVASGGSAPAPGPAADVTLVAMNVAFDQTAITAPAGAPFKLAFDNQDQGTAHNVAIKDAAGALIWQGEIFPGVATRVYDVPALAAGSYTFLCIVHPTMTGSVSAQ
ncbi:MAG: cytochrome c oxidase subunit 4 [Candidatus Limnocylindrales bacterium]